MGWGGYKQLTTVKELCPSPLDDIRMACMPVHVQYVHRKCHSVPSTDWFRNIRASAQVRSTPVTRRAERIPTIGARISAEEQHLGEKHRNTCVTSVCLHVTDKINGITG